MSVPLSLKNKFFGLDESRSSRVLGGYCHKKLETIKVKGNSTHGHWAFKGSFHLDAAGQVKYSDEFSYGFPFMNRFYLQARMDRKGGLRYHLDLGQVSLQGHKVDLSATLKTDTALAGKHWRLAQHYKTKGLETRNRLELDSASRPCLSSTTRLKHKQIKASTALMVHLDNLSLQRYDASLLVKIQKGMQLALTHSTPLDKVLLSQTAMGKVSAGLTFKADKKTILAAQLIKNGDKLGAKLGVQHKACKYFSVKAKVNNNAKCTFMLQKKLSDMMSLSVAAQVNLSKNAKTLDLSKSVPLPLGYQVEFKL